MSLRHQRDHHRVFLDLKCFSGNCERFDFSASPLALLAMAG